MSKRAADVDGGEMTDNLQMDVISSLLAFSEDIRGRGELSLLDEDLFTEPYLEIFKGLQSVDFIPSAYIDSITDSEFQRFISSLRSNAIHNTGFPDVVTALRKKIAGERLKGKLQSLVLSDTATVEDLQQIIAEEKQTATNITINAAEVITRPVPWLVENFLVRGALNGFQGIQGEGKSWVIGSLACAVADGGYWLDDNGEMIPIPQGRVLIANFDDDMSYTIVPRLRECGVTEKGLKNIEILDRSACVGMSFADKRLGAVFEKVKPDLAVFDTLQHFIGIKTDMNRANDVNAVLSCMQNLAEKYNTAVIIVEHINKLAANGGGGHSVNWGLGSVAIAGLLRTLWTIGKLRNTTHEADTRAIVCSKGNLMKYVPPAKLFRINNGLEWCGVDNDITAFDLVAPDKKRGRPSEQADKAQELICELLIKGDMKSDELEKAVFEQGISAATYRRARKAVDVKSDKRDGVWYSTLCG